MNFKLNQRTLSMAAVIGLLAVAFQFHRPITVGGFVVDLAWLAVAAALAGCLVDTFGWTRNGRIIRLVVAGTVMSALVAVAFIQPFSIAANALYAGGFLILFVCAERSARIESANEKETLRFGQDNSDEEPEWDLYREVHRARHFNRPLSLAVLSPTLIRPDARLPARISGDQLVKADIEILGDSLAGQINSCDILMFRDGLFVLVLSETELALAEGVMTRLASVAETRHGVSLSIGIAGFPNEEVTLTGLWELAISRLARADASVYTVPRTDGNAMPNSASDRFTADRLEAVAD
ncbi:MAG: hypothetical protein IID46_09505 [Planctomycetes bacterium]|nr:hypothetical protein [Planctomycetota bacterium]